MPSFALYRQLFYQNRRTFLYLVSIAVLQVLCTSYLVGWVIFQAPTLQLFTWLEWLAIYAAFALLLCFSILPNSFVAFLGGFFLHFAALPFMLLSYALAVSIGFWVAKQIDGGNFAASIAQLPQTRSLLANLRHSQWGLVILARLSPVLPFGIVNQILYSTGISFRVFVLASLVGVLPRLVLMIWLGSQAADLLLFQQGFSWQSWQQMVQLLLILFSLFGVSWLLKKAMKKV